MVQVLIVAWNSEWTEKKRQQTNKTTKNINKQKKPPKNPKTKPRLLKISVVVACNHTPLTSWLTLQLSWLHYLQDPVTPGTTTAACLQIRDREACPRFSNCRDWPDPTNQNTCNCYTVYFFSTLLVQSYHSLGLQTFSVCLFCFCLS